MPLALPRRSFPLLLALWAVGCQKPGPITEAPDEPAVSKPDAVDRTPPAPAADPTHPLELVPARARAMIMARSPQRLAQLWGRDRFLGRFPAKYEQLVHDMRRETGHDLLDPSALAAIGVDPTAPVGVAVLSMQPEAIVVFGGCSNPTAMIELMQRLEEGKPLKPEVVGEAQLVRVNDEATLVLRHGMFAVVVVNHRASGRAPDYAQEVARIDPAQSLAHAATMERAHAGLPHEADAHAMLDLAGLLRDDLDRSRLREQEMVGESSRRLAEARQRGASAEEMSSLQQQAQQEQEFVARRRRERQVGEVLLSRTLGAVEGIGLSVDGDERGLRGRMHVALAPEAAFRELFVSSERAPTAIAALGDAPQLVVSAQLDPGVAIDLLAQAALASGSSYAELNDEALRELRVDFDRTVRPLLDGRGTFVLTTASTVDPARATGLEEAMGGVLAIGVSDEAKARGVLDDVVATHPDAGFVAAPEISGYTLSRTDQPRRLGVGVVGGQLVVGTDMAALRRMRDGQAGPAGTHFSDPEPWQRLTEGAGVGRLAMHHRLPIALVLSFMGEFDSFDFPRNPDDQLSAEFPGEDVFSIPRSPATERAEKERNKALDAKSELRNRDRKRRQIVAWNEAAALGITAGVVREVETGLMIEGGHYVTGGIPGYLEALVGLTELDERDPDPALARADERLDVLEARLLEVRRKDIRREQAKRAKAGR